MEWRPRGPWAVGRETLWDLQRVDRGFPQPPEPLCVTRCVGGQHLHRREEASCPHEPWARTARRLGTSW